MIKKLKDAIKDFYNDKTPIYIKEFLIFAIFVAIVEVVMTIISFPRFVFGALGIYAMFRTLLEAFRRS